MAAEFAGAKQLRSWSEAGPRVMGIEEFVTESRGFATLILAETC